MNSARKIVQVIATGIAVLAMLLSSAHVQPASASGQAEEVQSTGVMGSKMTEMLRSALHKIREKSIQITSVQSAPTGTVTLWHTYGPGTADETALNQVIQNAEAAYPGLDIVTEFHDFGNMVNDYRTAVDSSGGPDLYILANDDIGNQARDGYILNIDSYLQGQLTTVDQATIDGMTVNGQLYGVPESAKAVVLYYNKTLVPTPPTTTAELLALLQSNETFAVPGPGAYYLYGFWNAFGGQLMDAAGHCTADQGGFVPAMQYFKSLQTAGAMLEMDYAEAQDQFSNGQIGMYINGPWALNDLKTALGSDLGVALLPSGPSGMAKPLSGPDGFYVNPNTTNKADIVELALFLTNQASSQIFTNVANHIPVRSDVTSSDPLIDTFAQAAAQGEPRPQNREFNAYWQPFGDMFGSVLSGAETPTAGVQNACDQMNASNTLNMHFQVRANEDRIEVIGWPAGVAVDLSINNPGTTPNPDYTASQTIDGTTPWGSGEPFTSFDLGGIFDIKAGFVVSIDDGVFAKTHTVKTLSFTTVNPITDTVTGKAANNSQVDVWACNDGPCVNRHVTASGTGVWTADFAQTGTEPDEQETIDLRGGTWIDSSQRDDDSDNTMFGMNVANPHFGVRANTEELELYEWPIGKTVNVEIDDPGTAPNPDYETTAVIDVAPWDSNQTYAYLRLDDFDIQAGHIVSVTYGATTKTHTVSSLQFTDFDIPDDVVIGTATPNTRVDVWACGDAGPCINRHVDSDGTGAWSADFMNPGDEEDEQETFNISYGTWVDSSETDTDSDYTIYGVNLPNTRVEAIINENAVEGYEWPENALITLEIDDPDMVGTVDYTDSQTATYPEWDPHNTFLRFDLTNFTLEVGQTVKLTDGVTTKQLVIVDVKVTGWDYEADTVTGIAPSDVSLWVNLWVDEWSPRHIQSDVNGNWTADYSIVGDEDFEQFTRNIINGSTGDVNVSDEDGDATRFVWDTYSIWVAPANIPLVAALTLDVDLNHPGYVTDEWTVLNLLYEPLFRQGNNGALVPAAATGYTVSADGLVYTIPLRANKWSDGQAVTAKHYVDGFLRILNPDTATEYASLLFDIQGARDFNEGLIVNPASVGIKSINSGAALQITLTQKTAYFPKILSMPGFFPVRVDRINANGSSWTEPGKFVANGPYKLVEHDAGHFLLAKNPQYYNAAKVSLQQIGLAIYRDPNEPFEAYKRGEVDVITAPTETLNDPMYRFERVYSDLPGIFYIGLNLQRGPTNAVLVRQALAAATDRDALLDVLGTPWRQGATGVIPPELPGYQGTNAGFPFNPTQAQDLLAQAGYPGGAGLPTIHLYGSDAPSHQLVLDTVAAQWQTVLGITVETHYRSDFNQWISSCEPDPAACEYNGFRLGWYVDYFDTHSILGDLFHPDTSFSKRMGWDNLDYRNLIDQSRAALNATTRISLLQQAETILVEDEAAVIPLYFFDRVDLVKPGFKSAYGVVPYYEQWTFKAVSTPAIFSKTLPANNALKIVTNPSLSWAASTYTAEYEYCVDTSDNDICDTEWIGTTSTNASLSGLINDTNYYWQVRANNALGTTDANAGAWWTFKVIISAPTLVSPNNADNVLTQQPMFDWDDVGEAGVTGYTIQVSTSSTFATISHTANSIESTYTPAVNLPKGKLYWRVRSTGDNGPSAWSDVRFYQGPYPPAAPVLKLPANNSLTKDYTPTFKWSALVIPASAAPFDKYQLQVATDSAFTSMVLEQDISGLTGNQFTPTEGFDPNTKYYWRVRGVNTLPENGAWSAIWSFRTVMTPPTLVTPANGSPVKELRPRFDWDAPTGPGAVSGYTIQISRNSGFTLVIHTGNPTASEYVPTVNLPKNTTLYWRVLAKGVNGPSAYQTGYSVSMPINPPPTPVLVSPANNAILRVYNNPTLKWKPITFPDASFKHYQVQVATDTAFSSLLLDNTDVISRATGQLVTSLSLTPNTRYYWRVRTVNTSDELSNWSTAWTIRAAISAPTLQTPSDDATGVSRKPLLIWENVTGNTGYVLQVWKAGTTPVLVKTVTLPPNVSQYQFITNLLPNTNYFWKIQTKSSIAPSTWSQFDFRTGP